MQPKGRAKLRFPTKQNANIKKKDGVMWWEVEDVACKARSRREDQNEIEEGLDEWENCDSI